MAARVHRREMKYGIFLQMRRAVSSRTVYQHSAVLRFGKERNLLQHFHGIDLTEQVEYTRSDHFTEELHGSHQAAEGH